MNDEEVEDFLEEIEFQLPGRKLEPARLRLAIVAVIQSADVRRAIAALVAAMPEHARQKYVEACRDLADTENARKALKLA